MEASRIPGPDQAADAPAKRRRGVVPPDLRRRIDNASTDFSVRHATRLIAGELDGIAPDALTDQERAELRETWTAGLADPALEILGQVGYGDVRSLRRPRRERGHGIRRDARLVGVVGKLPRALALRMPTTADTHRSGRNDGKDRWGRVKCSHTLRPDHMGLVAAACGLWHSRAGHGEEFVDLTAGELVQLLTGRRRVGGRDVVWIHRLLAELEALELRAVVQDSERKSPSVTTGETNGPSAAHHIPSGPIAKVERRIGDRWVAAADYADAIDEAAAEQDGQDLLELRAAERAGCEGLPTIRIHLAKWVLAELAHDKRRPVFIDFAVWAHLRPSARRLHTWLQALGRDDHDGRRYFYLGPPTLYTLGLAGQRRDRAAAIVRHDLTAIWHADRRYHDGDGFREHTHANTRIPAFACDAAKIRSCPTPKAMATKSPPRRPSGLRGAFGRVRRHSILASRGVHTDQLDQGHVRRVGQAAARREAEQVREAIYKSMGAAANSAREAGPFDPGKALDHKRRQGGDRGDDDHSG